MPSNTGIYVIINRLNGNTYVGSAVNFRRRWGIHKRHLNKGIHHSSHLQNAWNKYGEGSFSFTIERLCDRELLLVAEQEVIDLLRPEYNMSPNAGPSQLGVVRSEKFKAAVRANNLKRAKRYGGVTIRQLVAEAGSVVRLATAEMRVLRGWDPVEAASTPAIPYTDTRAGKKRK